MADITRGETFVDGEQVTGARLNNHVTGAVITESFVSGKGTHLSGPLLGDWMVYWKGGTLYKTQLTNVVGLGGAGTVTSVGLTGPVDTYQAVTGSPVTGAGTLELHYINQAQGEVLIGPAGASGTPTWRRIEARDTWKNSVVIASTNIDWNLGDVFSHVLTTNRAFVFANNESGRVIDVLIGQSASWVISFPATVKWEGGTVPVMTTGNGKWDWYRFTQGPSGFLFGVRLAANMS